MSDAKKRWNRVIAALQLLAADADDQVRSFPPYVSVADEIALMLQDALLLCEQDAEGDDVQRLLLTSVKDLDATLDMLSGASNASFWSNESLASDIRWQRLRDASRRLLQQLGVQRQHPTLDDTFMMIDDGSGELID